MKKQGSIALALVGFLCVVVLGGQARAVESLDSMGGNNAADYQPPTDNPQNIPASNLQTTSTGLQPVPGQTDVNQQNLAGVGNLQVVGTQGGEVNSNTTTIPTAEEEKSWMRPVVVGLGVTVLVLAGYAVLRSPEPKNSSSTAVPSEAPSSTVVATNALPKKSKKSQAKKLPKKKTAKKRKTR